MEEKTNMRYVDTNTATVKMTSGVPFTGSPMSGSSIEDEFENHENDLNHHQHGHNRPESSPARTPSRRRVASIVSGVSDGKDNIRNSDLKENNSKLHLRKNINEQQVRHASPHMNNFSEIRISESEQSSVVAEDSNNKPEQNNIIYQDIPSQLNSSAHKLGVNTYISGNNGTGSYALNAEQTIAHRFDNSNNKSPAGYTGSDRSRTNLHHPPDNMQANVVNMDNAQVMGKGRPSSSSPDKPSTFSNRPRSQPIISSTNPREQFQSEHRLSQSLENTQESLLRQWKDGMITSNSMSAISNVDHKHKQKPRVNPFNDILIDEDHFSDSCENYFRTDRRSTGSTKSSSTSQGADWWQEQSDVSFAELGLSEDHFSHPQGHFGLSRAEELELAIENCKELIRESASGSEKQKNLVLKLVQLRIKLQEVKEGPEPVPDNVKVILSHKMLLKNSRTSKYYCERCNGAIWGMLQVWYRCTECGYRCHEKCLQQILRTCAKAKVLENPTLITEICPKESNSLAGQNYRCWECRLAISYKSGHSEPRLCDYMGRYYCEFCHWNDAFVIPARVLHSWDFMPRKVCRSSKQFLKLMQKKAVIRIQDINPMLFVYVEQLNQIKKLREEMMLMKKYILSCPNAMLAKLLLLLENRQHFVECSDRYSMQDLLDAENALLPELVNVHRTWGQHIKVDCELCQGRGFCCELCGDKEILFPFDSTAVVCAKCSTVLHRHCFAKANLCPRCERRGKRMKSGS